MGVLHCLGAGLVGSYVAKRLVQSGHDVHIHELEPGRVTNEDGVTIHKWDALDACKKLDEFGEFDIVVNMLPGEIGSIATGILTGFPYKVVDLSFSEETPDNFTRKAIENGSSVLWDVGIAPGLSNMLLSEASRKFGKLKNGEVRVGGNPTKPSGGWNYMAPFSPRDVIAEYTRPARVIRDSVEVSLPAITDRHHIDIPGKGQMECFLTDGLRSVLNSIPASELSEYTVRWPGHIQKFIDLRDEGVLDEDELEREWQYREEVPEFTWIEVRAEGEGGETMLWTVQDHGGEDGHSMARSTGLVTLCCIEEWLNDSEMLPSGIHAPEDLGADVIQRVIAKMKDENVEISGP